MKVLRIVPVLAILLLATPALAQLDTRFLGNQPDMRATPEFPRPGEEVTVSLSVPSSRINNSDVIWSLNGEVVENATNQRQIKFVAGELGTIDSITASIVRSSGIAEVYAMNVRATYIDIVLEPQTRVPDFYKGRALPSVGSQVNATVLVNNGDLVEGNLLYTWRLNNTVLAGGSIRGTNKVSFNTPRGSESILSVEVGDGRGIIYGREVIAFDSEKPEMVFYETDALYGTSINAIGRPYVLIGSAATIVAEPYNLDIRTYNNPDIIEWEIDNVPQSNNGSNPYRKTIQKVEEEGSATMNFHVRSTTQLLQGTRGRVSITY